MLGRGDRGAGRGARAIPGATIFSPIEEAASAAAAGIPETSMGARHGPRPPAGGGAPGPGTSARAARARGAGARPRPELRGGGLPGGGGRGAAAALLQERKAATAELVGGPVRRGDPRPPGMDAAAVQSSSPPAGARPRKAGVERRDEIAGPGKGPLRRRGGGPRDRPR